MPGVLDTFRAFRRRLAVPRVLSPVLPARHPRRCCKCGGLIIPDRSRRYSFARPELVDAMGIQIKPGVGVSFKKGVGVIVADSSKPCCCTPTCPTCGDCAALSPPVALPQQVTLVISSTVACPCVNLTGSQLNVPTTSINATYLLNCNYSYRHGGAALTVPSCSWGWESPDDSYTSYDTYILNGITGNCQKTGTVTACLQLRLWKQVTGHLRLDAQGVTAANNQIAIWSNVSVTTTNANSCSVASLVTFTINACGSFAAAFGSGTATAQAV